MDGLIVLGSMLAYFFIGFVVVGMVLGEDDTFDGSCLIGVLFWPIFVLFLMIVGMIALALNIGHGIRKLFTIKKE